MFRMNRDYAVESEMSSMAFVLNIVLTSNFKFIEFSFYFNIFCAFCVLCFWVAIIRSEACF